MPTFERTATASAPAEEVWKLLYDPARIPQWWVGFDTVADLAESAEGKAYTLYPTGYPDFPMPQTMRTTSKGCALVMSCLTSDLEFSWQLEPVGDGQRTRITVHVDIPDAEAHRLDAQQIAIDSSIAQLAALAAAATQPM